MATWALVSFWDYAGSPMATLNIIPLVPLASGRAEENRKYVFLNLPPELSLGSRSPGSMGSRHNPPSHPCSPNVAPTAGPAGWRSQHLLGTGTGELTSAAEVRTRHSTITRYRDHDRQGLQALTCHGRDQSKIAHGARQLFAEACAAGNAKALSKNTSTKSTDPLGHDPCYP